MWVKYKRVPQKEMEEEIKEEEKEGTMKVKEKDGVRALVRRRGKERGWVGEREKVAEEVKEELVMVQARTNLEEMDHPTPDKNHRLTVPHRTPSKKIPNINGPLVVLKLQKPKLIQLV